MRSRLLVLLIVMMSVSMIISGCGSDEASGAEQDEETNGTFTVGMEAGYPPFNWTQQDDSNGVVPMKGNAEYAGGYDVEIAKRIADSLGKELEVVKTQWDGLVPALNSEKIDGIIAGMSPTSEREKSIDFSDIYYHSDLVMVVKNGGDYEDADSLDDFSGSKVTAQLNTFHYSVIDQIDNVKKQPAMDDFPAMRVALESGTIDGYVTEKPEAISAQNANENFKMVEFEDGFSTKEEDTSIAVGLKKGSDLTEKINDALADISEEDQQAIMEEAIKNQPSEQ